MLGKEVESPPCVSNPTPCQGAYRVASRICGARRRRGCSLWLTGMCPIENGVGESDEHTGCPHSFAFQENGRHELFDAENQAFRFALDMGEGGLAAENESRVTEMDAHEKAWYEGEVNRLGQRIIK